MKRRRARRWPRWCGRCKATIGRRHKWHVEGCTIFHDDCDDPEMKLGGQMKLLKGDAGKGREAQG